jgi:hypothetical protein
MADPIEHDAFDPQKTDKVKIDAGAWVPCRICWDVFMRLSLTARYCANCERAAGTGLRRAPKYFSYEAFGLLLTPCRHLDLDELAGR